MWIVRTIARLPLSVLYAFGRFLAFVVADVFKYRREVVESNMRRAFPEKGEAEIRRLRKEFYHWLADVFMETLKSLDFKPEEMRRRVDYKNPEILEKHDREGTSCIIAASHTGNWEWVLLSGERWKNTYDAAYMPISNAFFDQLMRSIRSHFGSVLIPGNKLVREEIRRKHIPRGICMVADQRPMPESAYWLEFLNQETGAFRGIDTMAKFLKIPVYYAHCLRKSRGYYELELIPIGAPPYEKTDFSIMTNYFACVEKTIAADPAAWLWTHKRWKDSKPAEV